MPANEDLLALVCVNHGQ